MSNPEKQWSWRRTLGSATGSAIGGGAAGAVSGSVAGGPAGAAIGGAIGATGGFVSTILGSAIGYWWDELLDWPVSFGSAALYSAVVSGTLSAVLCFLALAQLSRNLQSLERGVFAITLLAGFLGALSSSLIDDLRASADRRQRLKDSL